MDQSTSVPTPDLSADLADLTVPELHAYIKRLRDYIRGLEEYNQLLEAERSELQRRELLSIAHHP